MIHSAGRTESHLQEKCQMSADNIGGDDPQVAARINELRERIVAATTPTTPSITRSSPTRSTTR